MPTNRPRDTCQARLQASQQWARYLGLGVAVTGLAVLIGWAFELPLLKSAMPGFVAMKPNTAVALVLLGSALTGLVIPGPRAGLARGAALLGAAIGALTLAQTVSGVDFGVDQILFREPAGAVLTVQPGRPAPETSVCLMVIGLALALLDRGVQRSPTPAQALTLVAGLVVLFVTLGYALEAKGTALVHHQTTMAVNTGLALGALALGVWLARPDRGVAAHVSGDDLGGRMARRVLPMTTAVLLTLTWLRVQGEANGWFGTLAGVKLQALAGVVAVALVVVAAARNLAASDVARTRAERDLQQALRTNELILQHMPDSLTVIGVDGTYRVFNDAARRMVGRGPGTSSAAEFHASLAIFGADGVTPVVLSDLPSMRALRGEAVTDNLLRLVRDDGCGVWASESAVPLFDATGGVEAAITVARDITAERAATDALRTTIASLRHKTEEVDAFVYAVSHDLRSPLVTIQGFCHELRTSLAELTEALAEAIAPALVPSRIRILVEKDAGSALFYITAATDKFEKLIGVLLGLSRAGRRELRCDLLDVAQIADAALAASRAKVATSGAEIVRGPLPAAYGDATAVGQVVANLLDNAMTYLQPGRAGKIAIAGEVQDAECHYWVADNGIGIPEAGRERLFQVFQRFHPEVAAGEGVGLALTKRLVERLGGRIWAESAVDQGTTLHFTLPGRKPALANQELPDAKHHHA